MKLLIVGSCVSRDVFSFNENHQVEIVKYVARTSLASAFAKKGLQNFDLSAIGSSFQREMVSIDLGKKLESILRSLEYDYIILDFIDERFNIYLDDDGVGICTLSNEILSSGWTVPPERVIRSASDDFFKYWEAGWSHLVGLLSELGVLHRLILNKVYWAKTLVGGDPFPRHSDMEIENANNFLDRIYNRALQDLRPAQVVEYSPEMLLGDKNHKWGASPFHYIENLYAETYRALRKYSMREHAIVNQMTFPEMPLSATIQWLEFEAKHGESLHVDIKISGGVGVSENKALICLEFFGHEGRYIPEGFFLSNNPEIGAFQYLNTGSGQYASSLAFALPSGCHKVKLGVRSWWPEAELNLDMMQVRSAPKRKPIAMISVDVEALTGRATADHVDRLIWGRFGDGFEAGIKRLCDIFSEYGVRATFFVDYGAIQWHGDLPIYQVANYLAERGHDVQLHVHSEEWVRFNKLPNPSGAIPGFNILDKDSAVRCLEHCISHYESSLGYRPQIFRPGGMAHSVAMYEAVSQLDIPATSALFRGFDKKVWSLIEDEPLLSVSNVVEIPLDIALDPLVNWEPFDRTLDLICSKRRDFPSVSMLLHSTSLLYRERSSNSKFVGYHKPYEEQIRAYLEKLHGKYDFFSHADLMGSVKVKKFLDVKDIYI